MNRFEKSLIFAKALAVRWPAIIQAPMAGGITTPSLVAAVSNSNGLGSFATGYLTPKQTLLGIKEIKRLTKKTFIVNVFAPNKKFDSNKYRDQIEIYNRSLKQFHYELGMHEKTEFSQKISVEDNFFEIIDILLAERVPVVSFTFGTLPNEIIAQLKENGTHIMGTATSLEEAKILAASGVDTVIAQGYEAGGHRGGFFTKTSDGCIGTIALIPQLVNNIKCPVVAAGGIMTGQGILAAISAGASAVQLGTAFLTTQESGANPGYKSHLLESKDKTFDITALTKAYTGKEARGIKNRFMEKMEVVSTQIPPYPIPNILSSSLRKKAIEQQNVEIMSMWCGQGISSITSNLTVSKLLENLRCDFDDTLSDLVAIKKNL